MPYLTPDTSVVGDSEKELFGEADPVAMLEVAGDAESNL